MDISQYGLVPHFTASTAAGDKFGKLTVLAIGKKAGTYRYTAVCKCDCGGFPVLARIDALKDGRNTSCGCMKGGPTHGLHKHPLYRKWHHMMQRCYDAKSARYYRYGERGITVCDRWHDVRNFVSDMEPTYEPGLELDRINNDGNYHFGNCRWISHRRQASNKSSNINITFNGKTQCLQHWATELGFKYQTLWERIRVLNWPPERALTEPSK